MNLIVTVPKDYDFSEKLNITKDGGIAVWEMGRLPAQDVRYETIYFVQKGKVRYKATIHQTALDGVEFIQATTLSEPLKVMESFRGFRYENPFDKIEPN